MTSAVPIHSLTRPLPRAMLAQLGGALLLIVLRWLGATQLLDAADFNHLMAWGVLQGALAACVAALLRSPWWWWPIHLAFVPALMLLLSLGIHPGWYLGSFILLLLTYWRTDRSQVPLYLSNTVTAKAVAGLVPLQSRQFLDIGCGHGGLLRRVALQHPCCNFVGIEHAPLPWLLGRMLGALRTNVDVRYGDFWRMPIAGFDVVYAFLSPVPMPRLWAKACEEMKEGSLLISNSFEVPGVKPARVLQLDDARRTRLLIYKVPGRR